MILKYVGRFVHAVNRKFHYWRLRKYARLIQRDERRMTSDQEKAFGIIRSLSSKPESELMIAPISEKFFIRNGDIFVIIERDMVSIINGVYHYDIPMSDGLSTKIRTFLYRVIERRRSVLENEVRSRIDRSLEYIYYEIKNLKGVKKDE